MINKETPLAPFIDAAYYTEVYKANKNARIQGTFNNVQQHIADFDAFRCRASEIVDRLVSNKITAIGGIEFAGELAQATLKKATAAFVEHWYIKGFVMSDLDSQINVGGMSARQMIRAKTFREIAPLSALTLIQKSGMWDNKIIGVDLTKELADMGIAASEIVTWGDALAVFEEKGMGLNFNIEGDLEPVLTNSAGIIKYVKIASTNKQRISFDILGGSDNFQRSHIEIDQKDGFIVKAEAFLWSKAAIQDTTTFWTKYEDGKMGVYIAVKDDIEDKIIAINNVFPDQEGEYGVLGVQDNSDDLSLMTKLSVIGDVSKSELEISTSELNLILPLFGLGTIPAGTLPVTDYSIVLTEMFEFLKDYKLDIVNPDGSTAQVPLRESIQGLSDAIGSYSNDDANGVLDDQLSVIRNISILAENVNSALNRISANEVRLTNVETQATANKDDIAKLAGDLTSLNDRVKILEAALSLTAKTWTGDVQLQVPSINIAGLIASDGKPFDLNTGDTLSVSIKHSSDNAGVTQPITVGGATPKIFVIPNGNQSDAIGVQIAPDGSLTATITNGNDNIPMFALYELVEDRKAPTINLSYSKDESDTKFYTNTQATAEKTRVDTALATKAPVTTTYTKAEAATEKTRVDNELSKKLNSALLAPELAKKVDINLANAIVDAVNNGKFMKIDNGKITYVAVSSDAQPYISQTDTSSGIEQRFYATGVQELFQGGQKISETTALFANQYEEKEITITPAVYGWKEIIPETYNFTQDDVGKIMRWKSSNTNTFSGIIGSHTSGFFTGFYANMGIIPSGTAAGLSKNDLSTWIKGDGTGGAYDGTKTYNYEIDAIASTVKQKGTSNKVLVEIWDIITPAVKATVLVKK